MIRLFYAVIVGSGLLGIALGTSRLPPIGHAPRADASEQQTYYVADPAKTVFHVAGCPYLHCENPARFPHLSAAESFGRPCEHCLSGIAQRQASIARQP